MSIFLPDSKENSTESDSESSTGACGKGYTNDKIGKRS